MAEYTAEDRRAFKLKDLLNAKFSALKCAGLNNEGKGISAEDMLAEAEKYRAYLMLEQDPIPTVAETKTETNKKESKAKSSTAKKEKVKSDSKKDEPKDVVTVPSSLNQKKVMDKIAEEVGAKTEEAVTALRASVLAWVAEEFGGTQYPSKEESIKKYLDWRNSNG